MNKKVCLITGANSGIGKITTRELARLGMTILMVCRNIHAGEAVRDEIVKETQNQDIKVYSCDLSKQADIVSLANTIRNEYHKLDVLINNAGAVLSEHQITVDGFEATFATNHLGPFLLTNLLLDLLKEGHESRIITVSSEAHRMANLDFNDLQVTKKYNSWIAYGNSKLANILFTKQLAKKIKGSGITANCLHPGIVATNFGGTFNGITGAFFSLFRPLFIGAEKGAETTIYLATSSEVKGITGEYFSKKKTKIPSKEAMSSYNAQKLWEVSQILTKLDERMN